MKNILLYAMAFSLILSACQKKTDNSIGGQSVDERLTIAMAAYQKKLTDAPYGWILVDATIGKAVNQGAVTDGPKAAFSYYMKFNESNQVTMYADFDTIMAVTPKVSSYRVKALQRPALIFDTYSYIHVPSDPDPAISLSPYGAGLGWGTDFEFSFADNVDATQLGDTIHLTGNLNSSNAVLIKATKEQQDAYMAGQLKTIKKFPNYLVNYFKRININSKTYEVFINDQTHSITLNYLDANGNLLTFTTNFYYTSMGIVFITPFVNGTTTITGFTNISYNPSTEIISLTAGGIPGQIIGTGAPLKVDLGAPKRWYSWATSSLYVSSSTGFHVNGVDDAFGVRTLAGFKRIDYYPQASAPYDYNRIAATTSYGPAIIPTFTTDGRVIFPNSGFQFGTVPAAATAIYVKHITQMFLSQGYYLVQTGFGSDQQITYDMVSALDGKAWINWHY